MALARVAMWSGPRNVSTALMRSWEHRADCAVIDEPFYAYYLSRTGLDHPGRAQILASQPTSWREVAGLLTAGPAPPGVCVLYQKHMTHHLLPEVDRSSLAGLRHAFLIREPAQVLSSYARVRDDPTLADLGLAQQVELYERFGGPVVDAGDLLRAPSMMLAALCAALAVPFDAAMLSWPAGRRESDGVWAPHWYDGVIRSTGFAAPPQVTAEVPDRLLPLLQVCRPYYDRMAVHRLTTETPHAADL